MSDLIDFMAQDPKLTAKFKAWALGSVSSHLNDMVTSIAAWGLANQGAIGALDDEEVTRLKRLFGHLVDELTEQAEAQQKELLSELLEDIEI